ncbi:hypothetical protein [Aurantiacibacter poecillastricola]|uniref:hypothetical protein n=1 Tax=Aurantiacibacter poecillastricola TaxID=3064385 RepID=UPI00273F4344|nr:hypothetical protein [Aurantiacibacter sp. 219JJ12-13]MDP5263058.1 hypothetical protein [Aurantiacibacter sp. 219JJ12-13]
MPGKALRTIGRGLDKLNDFRQGLHYPTEGFLKVTDRNEAVDRKAWHAPKIETRSVLDETKGGTFGPGPGGDDTWYTS